jgi:lipopolysaccharide transport system ATP-binding protein
MIHVEGIGKRYRITEGGARYGTLRDAIAAGAKRLVGRGGPRSHVADFWALRDVSFDVAEGEVVGIIGRNGAGKSTLLKILSRIMPPTEGRIRLKGRVASLLEVGTGFHPELTGRENIYMNGAVLGMRRAEIRRKFDEIVAFSEVEKFLETPVKHYSSGMYVRLAFAVAAHLEPEILIVDEVLAVGDAEFQRKCLGKMGEVARGGRTVLFVSHNMGAVKRLCSWVVLLEGGRVKSTGSTEEVVRAYAAPKVQDVTSVSFDEPGRDDAGMLLSVSLLDVQGNPTKAFSIDEDHYIQVEYVAYREIAHHRIVVQILTFDGEVILTSSSADFLFEKDPLHPGRHAVSVKLPKLLLNEGHYVVSVAFGTPRVRRYDQRDNAISFTVEGNPFSFKGDRAGYLCGALEWKRRTPTAIGHK